MQRSAQLYEKYGRLLEKEHWGEYLAISESGKTVLGKDLLKVANKALADIRFGVCLYKVGERAVYKL